MYKLEQQFSFGVKTGDTIHQFTGNLYFKSNTLYESGTLHSNEEIERFENTLNQEIEFSNGWTLEILSKILFEKAEKIFINLYGLQVYFTESTFRKATYYKDIFSEDILELSGYDN